MAKGEQDPVQQLLITARRNQILDAATRIFAAKGFQRATIRDIAKAAGIADGTIYNYFANKNDVLLGLLNRLNESDQRRDHFDQAAGIDLEQFVRGYVRHRFEVLTMHGFEVFQILLAELLVNQELRERYYHEVIAPTFAATEPQMQQLLGLPNAAADKLSLTMRTIAGAVLGLLMLRLLGDPLLERKWEDVPDLLSELIMQQIDAMKGSAYATDRLTQAGEPPL